MWSRHLPRNSGTSLTAVRVRMMPTLPTCQVRGHHRIMVIPGRDSDVPELPRTRPRTGRQSRGCGKAAISRRSPAPRPRQAGDRDGKQVRTALRRARSPGRTTSSRPSAMMSAPCAVHGPIPGISVIIAMSSSSAAVASASGSSRAVRQSLGEITQCADLPPGQPRVPEPRGIGAQHVGGGWEAATEARLNALEDPSGCRDRQLLSDDLACSSQSAPPRLPPCPAASMP